MKLKIFFSWQLTTDAKYNKYFILDCLKRSVKKLKDTPELKDVEFIIQEGINGESGSVQLASKIMDERIPECDIFIADLSIINYNFPTTIPEEYVAIMRESTKPTPNPNVLIEYGIAYKSIEEERIIGVLNGALGSLKEKPDLLPFDIKHLRFPLEYKYSAEFSEKEKAQNELVSKLTNALKETSIFALQHQKDRHKPLSTWRDWESLTNTSQKYYGNEIINEITTQIKTGIKKPNESIRLIGLSGLGKTRILLEIFRPNGSTESVNLNSRVLYLNCNNYPNADYQLIFEKLAKEGDDRIIILDNCSKIIHRRLLSFINNENNNISLISIDSNPEEFQQDRINGVNYILIKKDDLSSIVDQILIEDFSVLGEEKVSKIREFSQGIPLMAVLIGESIKNGEKFIGKLDDKELLDKLLGEKGQNEKFRTILKSCSIFNYFGIEDEFKSQLEFIATDKNITSLSGDNQTIINDFHETCTHYLKREIFEKKGRLIGLRPFPLAMSLAQEWLEPCTAERLLNVISSISKLEEPHKKNLSEAIAEQMKYLGYNDKAISIIDKIVGIKSPFDNAEVLNSELGSRLFRSFVEVNPVAVSKNLSRNFSSKSKEELLEVKTGRRNLVWVLEKLCFDKRTFNESAKILYAFAVAENENWSNNALGQFLQLFRIYLAGTEANLQERWEIIQWGLNKGNQEYSDLSIKAMKSGLYFGSSIRMGGAESQGSKKLIDYEPTFAEISEYWIKILSNLTSIAKSNNSNSESACDVIASSISSIFTARQGHLVVPFLQEISSHKKNNWDEGLKALKFVKRFDKEFIPIDLFEKIESLINILEKSDFKTRYKTLSNSYYLEDDESYSNEKIVEAIIKLADEFITEELSWELYFEIFYINQQINFYHFGKRLYELICTDSKKIEVFIQLSLKTILNLRKEDRNLSVLIGFILEADTEIKKDFYNSLSNNESLNYLLFHFLSSDDKGKDFFYLLFELIDKGKCGLDNFKQFNFSNSLRNCDKAELEKFSKKIFKYGNDGYVIILDLYFNLGYNNEDLQSFLIPIFKECIFKLGANTKKIRRLDYKWSQTICSILSFKHESDFAKYVNNSIIESISWENSYSHDHNIQKIYQILMKIHFQSIWVDLSNAFLFTDHNYAKYYGLKNILGSRIGSSNKSVGILFDGDLESIFMWCKSNIPLAPSRLAELTPIYGNENNEYSTWHPITKRLIDEFGYIEDVLRSLSSNMGTYSWSGSLVPLLEARKELFKSIENHRIELVSDWATKYLTYTDEEIKREKNKDEERFL